MKKIYDYLDEYKEEKCLTALIDQLILNANELYSIKRNRRIDRQKLIDEEWERRNKKYQNNTDITK